MIKLNFPNVGVYFLQKKILRKTATIQKKNSNFVLGGYIMKVTL